jgi:RNA polymerase sigma-70 factor (ECF subfamily)
MYSISFEEIYKQYSPQIFRVCMGYLNDPEQAKDVVQETFVSVWKNLSSFRHESKISTWIFRIATNNCLQAIEKSKRIQTTELPLNIEATVEDSLDDKLAFLYGCIAELEEIERMIISLVLEDLPQPEIASIIGVSHGNIRVKIHRIKGKLATKFKNHGQFE